MKYDLEERLINFAVRIIHVTEALPNTHMGKHVAGQIGRSGTSPAANYGEALGAESSADFIHKLKIAIKELRETRVWLLIIQKAEMIKPVSKLDDVLDENNQLIAIFISSIETAKKNAAKK